MGGRSTSRIEAGRVRDMIEEKNIKLIPALKGGPATTEEKDLTAEAVWPGAEFQTAEVKMAAGTAVSSSVEIYSESNQIGSSCNRKSSYKYLHYDKYQKNIFLNPPHSISRRKYVYE
jgi:hypothetical protein